MKTRLTFWLPKILTILSILGWIAYLYIKALASAYGSADGGGRGTPFFDYVILSFLIIFIMILLFGHKISSPFGTWISYFPVAISLLFFMMNLKLSDLTYLAKEVVEVAKSPYFMYQERKNVQDRKEFYAQFSRAFEYKGTGNNDKYFTWDNFFIIHDVETDALVGVALSNETSSHNMLFVGKILEKKLHLQSDSFERESPIYKKCLNQKGESLFDVYQVIDDPGMYDHKKRRKDYFDYWKVIEKYNFSRQQYLKSQK